MIVRYRQNLDKPIVKLRAEEFDYLCGYKLLPDAKSVYIHSGSTVFIRL